MRRNEEKILNSSVLADYNKVRGEAIPLTKAANHDELMRYFKCGNPDHDPLAAKDKAKVSLWRLLSLSTWKERWMMIFGLVMATFTGLGIPTWLILLARSLDTFSNIASLMSKVGPEGLMDYLRTVSIEKMKSIYVVDPQQNLTNVSLALIILIGIAKSVHRLCCRWGDMSCYWDSLRGFMDIHGGEAGPTDPDTVCAC